MCNNFAVIANLAKATLPRPASCQYLSFHFVFPHCLTDAQPVSQQALFALHSDEERNGGASVLRLQGVALQHRQPFPISNTSFFSFFTRHSVVMMPKHYMSASRNQQSDNVLKQSAQLQMLHSVLTLPKSLSILNIYKD